MLLVFLRTPLPQLQRRSSVIPFGTYPRSDRARWSGRQQIRHDATASPAPESVRAISTNPTEVASPLRTAFFKSAVLHLANSPSRRNNPSSHGADALRSTSIPETPRHSSSPPALRSAHAAHPAGHHQFFPPNSRRNVFFAAAQTFRTFLAKFLVPM